MSLVPNTFSAYRLSNEDAIEGSILSTKQQKVIQNQISLLAEKKLSLEPTTANFEEYIQKEAYYRGQLTALQYLITVSDELTNPPQDNT